jgi:hypothetical protein
MQTHADRLRDVLDEEARDCGDRAPASDAAIRVHLRFVAEALAHSAGGDRREQLEAFADELPAERAAPRDLAETLELVRQATAHELRLQFGPPEPMLADTIFAMDRRAEEAEISRGGPDAVADRAVVNRIGQAASLHAHTRFLVDALAATLPLDG